MNDPTTVLECLQRNTGRFHDADEIAVQLTSQERHREMFPQVLGQVQVELAKLCKAGKARDGRWRGYEHVVYTVA